MLTKDTMAQSSSGHKVSHVRSWSDISPAFIILTLHVIFLSSFKWFLCIEMEQEQKMLYHRTQGPVHLALSILVCQITMGLMWLYPMHPKLEELLDTGINLPILLPSLLCIHITLISYVHDNLQGFSSEHGNVRFACLWCRRNHELIYVIISLSFLNTLRLRQEDRHFADKKWIYMFEFWLKFHWSLFLGVDLMISQHWFR